MENILLGLIMAGVFGLGFLAAGHIGGFLEKCVHERYHHAEENDSRTALTGRRNCDILTKRGFRREHTIWTDILNRANACLFVSHRHLPIQR